MMNIDIWLIGVNDHYFAYYSVCKLLFIVDGGIGIVTLFGPVTSMTSVNLITMISVSKVKWISLKSTCSFNLNPPT